MALESAHAEYREGKQQVRRAATVLLVVGLLCLAFGLLSYLVSGGTEFTPLTQDESRNRLVSLLENSVLGCALLGCYYAAKRAPGAAFMLAVGIWIADRLLVFAIAPSAFLLAFLSALGVAVLMGRIVVLVLLIRGILAAHRLHRILVDIARIPERTEGEGVS